MNRDIGVWGNNTQVTAWDKETERDIALLRIGSWVTVLDWQAREDCIKLDWREVTLNLAVGGSGYHCIRHITTRYIPKAVLPRYIHTMDTRGAACRTNSKVRNLGRCCLAREVRGTHT